METSKTMKSELINTESSFIPQSIKTIKAIIPYGNISSDLDLENLKAHAQRQKQANRYTFEQTTFSNSKPVSNGTFQAFSEILKSSKKASGLHLTSHADRDSSSGAAHICEGIKGMRSLKDLSLNFGGLRQMTEEDLRRLVKGLKSLGSLESLGFAMWPLRNISSSGTRALCSALKSLTSLKRIKLAFKSKVMAMIIPNLGKALKKLIRLESVTLRFGSGGEIAHPDLLYLGHILHSLPFLKYLELDFSESGLSDLEMQGLSKGLRGLSDLTILQISLSDCPQMTDNAVQSIAESLKSLTSLQSFSLNLGQCHGMTGKSIQSIVQSLTSLISFESLSLSLDKCSGIQSEGLQSLWQGLPGLMNLKNLELSFYSWGPMINEKLEGFGQALNGLPLLESINICFKCSYLGDVGMKHFAIALRNLTSLKSLAINFEGTGLTSIHIREFAKGLKKLSSLENIELRFRFCERITRSGVETLIKAIKALNALRSIVLDLRFSYINPYIINAAVLRSMGQDFGSLTCLKRIKISVRSFTLWREGIKDLELTLKAMASSPSVCIGEVN